MLLLIRSQTKPGLRSTIQRHPVLHMADKDRHVAGHH